MVLPQDNTGVSYSSCTSVERSKIHFYCCNTVNIQIGIFLNITVSYARQVLLHFFGTQSCCIEILEDLLKIVDNGCFRLYWLFYRIEWQRVHMKLQMNVLSFFLFIYYDYELMSMSWYISCTDLLCNCNIRLKLARIMSFLFDLIWHLTDYICKWKKTAYFRRLHDWESQKLNANFLVASRHCSVA